MRKIVICDNCGYGIVAETMDSNANLTLQKQRFNNNVQLPKIQFTRWPHRPALIYKELRRLKCLGGRVLDIGCNTGLWLATLGEEWEKFGVELSSAAAEIARKFTRAEIFCGPIESYKAEPNSFDLITVFAVIEHVIDPKMLVAWTYEHLKPGGLFVLMTGDRESTTATQMGSRWPLYQSEDHVHFFSARSLSLLLSEFIILRREWRFMYMPSGMGSPMLRTVVKLKEILRLVSNPYFDHLYVYARKPF